MADGKLCAPENNFPLLTPMLVMRFETFKKQGRLVRSDEAQVQELLEHFASAGHIAIFISHRWWRTDVGHPDYTEGEKAHLKFRTVVRLVEGVQLVLDKAAAEEGAPQGGSAGGGSQKATEAEGEEGAMHVRVYLVLFPLYTIY
jgi:hypothetical protein